MSVEDDGSILARLDAAVPAPLARFDAFPKLPSTYKSRSESRGFITLFVSLVAFLLILNDVGEYVWGWPDFEFSVDHERSSFMNVNVDLVVNMPCKYLSVDLRDAVGDRLYLSNGFRRDGTLFDVSQATALKAHSTALSARQAIAQSRSSRGFFTTLFRRNKSGYRPTYNYSPDGSACRVFGSMEVKKVTANLHVTTLGHGYSSAQHVDHSLMNLSHVITEFSFGPYFPDITQPLDYSFEISDEPFTAYQYFLHVVPTNYIAPRASPLHTNQYSVTHYTRKLEHNSGTPGIFFKFDIEPLSITIHQRTTTLVQLFIRCVGVIGGVFVCMGYAVRIASHTIDAVSGASSSPGLVAAQAQASGAQRGLRAKWGGAQLRARGPVSASAVSSPMLSPYTPYTPYTPSTPYSPYLHPSANGHSNGSVPTSPNVGLGLPSASPTYAPAAPPSPGSPYHPALPLPQTPRTPASPYTPSTTQPTTPGVSYAHLSPSPTPSTGSNGGLPRSPNVKGVSVKKVD